MEFRHSWQAEDETIVASSAAMSARLWSGFYPFPIHGALILTLSRLRFESAWVHPPIGMKYYAREIEIPIESIVDVRIEEWPSLWRLILPFFFLAFVLLWPGLRRTMQGNLAVETQSATHRFRVGNPEAWVQALRELRGF